MTGDRRAVNLQAVADGRDLLGELYAERAKVERLESALKVIHTWANVPGGLVPYHVIELVNLALADVRK